MQMRLKIRYIDIEGEWEREIWKVAVADGRWSSQMDMEMQMCQ